VTDLSDNEVIKDQERRQWLENCVPFLVILAFAVLLLNRLFFWIYHPLLVWTDQSVYLEIAQLILQGKIPYRDVFDFNPPLIMYLNVIPVLVSNLLRVPAALGLSLTILLLNAFSCLFAALLVYKNSAVGKSLVLYSLIFFFGIYGQGLDTDMGQREHVFLLLYLPFFIARGLIWTGGDISRSQSIFVGLMAGLGLALKPQFVFCAALAELGFFIQYPRPRLFLRCENVSVLSVFLLYAVCFFILPQQARDNFFYQALPIYSWGNLWSLKSLMHMIGSESYGLQPFLNFISATCLAFFMRNKSPWILPLTFFTCGAFFNYFQGGQSWTYRLLPMAFGAYMLYGVELGIVLSSILQRFNSMVLLRLALAAALLLAISYSSAVSAMGVAAESSDKARFDLTQLSLGYFGSNPRSDLSPIFFCILANTSPQDTVLHLGTPIAPGFPAILQSGRRSASRYLYCFLVWLEEAKEKSGKKTFDQLEQKILANYGADITYNKPVLIMVQDLPMQNILSRYNFFENYMQGYSLIGKTSGHSIYKYTGSSGLFVQSDSSKIERQVIAILAGEKTVEQVAEDNNWDKKQLLVWVEKARQGLVDALSDRVGDKEQELQDEIKRLGDRIFDLNQQSEQLKLQIDALQKREDSRLPSGETLHVVPTLHR